MLSNVIKCSKGTLGGSQEEEGGVSRAGALVQEHLDRAKFEHHVRKGFSELKSKTSSPKPVTETGKPGGGLKTRKI